MTVYSANPRSRPKVRPKAQNVKTAVSHPARFRARAREQGWLPHRLEPVEEPWPGVRQPAAGGLSEPVERPPWRELAREEAAGEGRRHEAAAGRDGEAPQQGGRHKADVEEREAREQEQQERHAVEHALDHEDGGHEARAGQAVAVRHDLDLREVARTHREDVVPEVTDEEGAEEARQGRTAELREVDAPADGVDELLDGGERQRQRRPGVRGVAQGSDGCADIEAPYDQRDERCRGQRLQRPRAARCPSEPGGGGERHERDPSVCSLEDETALSSLYDARAGRRAPARRAMWSSRGFWPRLRQSLRVD